MTTAADPATQRLDRQLAFLAEAEKLKGVIRATPVMDDSRFENSAEHSWSLALWALVLADQADPAVDPVRAIKMLLLHDMVEIDVGDVPIHSKGGKAHDSAETCAAEARAAERIFGLLPTDMAQDFLSTWQEFEANETPTAIYAKSLDRAQPVMLNLQSGGGSWREYKVTWDQLQERVGCKINRGLPALWSAIKARIFPWFEDNRRL
ncbi:HD domain-containing protein [Thioclava sp. GXIMD4216]|uniref:HD domain-containing protein n=1 Tax=Thioclava litoralis TaxID=3076557 RepID=A0ABZ1DZB4_9RHOB|nr:HD domain-containing protein [Thioclava sp. FTW29]